jgi:hypothetical protein
MRLRALALMVLPLAGISCQLFFGVDDPPAAGADAGGGEGASDTTGSGGSTAVSSSSTGPAQCDVCLDTPDGWGGPVLRVAESGKAEPLCPNATIAVLAYEGAPAPHTCTACGCGAPVGGECADPEYHCWSGADCSGNALTTTDADGCLPVLLSGNTAGSCAVDAAPSPGGGSCPAVPGQVQGGTWQLTHGLCPLAEATGESCRDGSCFDTGGSDSAELCVYSSEATECPAGWDIRYDAFLGEVDDRTCGCTCTPTNEACNGGGYAFGPIIGVCPTVVAPGQCRNDVYSGDRIGFSYAATCLPGPSQPGGGFTPSDAVLICCSSMAAG